MRNTRRSVMIYGRTIKDVSENPALPDEFKFDKRNIELGTWHINRKPGETPYMSI
jgi:hypothetical protein